MRYTDKITQQKYFIIASIALAGFVFIIIRLWYLQLYHYEKFATLGTRNFTRIESVIPLRGNILDCNNELLATNKPMTSLMWHGTGNSKLSEEQMQTLARIEHILDGTGHALTSTLAQIKSAEKFSRIIGLTGHLELEHLSKILEQCPQSKNIQVKTSFERYYPLGTIACHALGYLGDLGTHNFAGKMGLEQLFEDNLRGQQGQIAHMINSFGSRVQQQNIVTAHAGQNLVTTLDISIQKLAEECMPAGEAGLFLLMNPQSGDIKTLISRPDFDPSLFLKPIDQETWKTIVAQKPFLNRAFNATYPPASIFKLITICAALEKGLITQDNSFFCCGYCNFKGRKYYCNNRTGHGRLSIQEGVARSCNIAPFEIAKHISINTLADYAHRFGLGQKTTDLFPEQTGTIPSTEWKKKYKGEHWWAGETLSAAIGQSYLLVTPIQIACMIGGLFEGYLVKPRILQNQDIIKTPVNVQTSTRIFLQESMQSAVKIGSAQRMNRMKDLVLYAKTGTAQVASWEKKELGRKEDQCHAWCACYLKYKDEEPMVMVILIEHAGSSTVATQVAKEFLIKYIKQCKNKKSS